VLATVPPHNSAAAFSRNKNACHPADGLSRLPFGVDPVWYFPAGPSKVSRPSDRAGIVATVLTTLGIPDQFRAAR
jgi:hypothetical protein